MATQAQKDEKAPARAADESSVLSAATPSQLAEKSGNRRDPLEGMATSAQLDEKRRNQFISSPERTPFAGAATSAQMAEKARNARVAPPLPSREAQSPAPPPYSADDAKRSELISKQWRSHDPRSSSTHSLVPSESLRDGRRTLLLVFIHGFMGNETSFQSFPAHIHNLLTITLAETHVVHTKIYPRYKSRKNITFARDDFSTWLEPHEGPNTEVILLGHSMGGILGAEVALQKIYPPVGGELLRHRLLGTINFDTPFLGMHPGVVGSGLSSIFRPAPEPRAAKSPGPSVSGANTPVMSSQASILSQSFAPSLPDSDSTSQMSLIQNITSAVGTPPPKDLYFDQPFVNDVRLPERKGLSNFLHFINKHSDGLTSATKEYFMSHLEFGGAMADYTGLKNRYQSIRTLEDVDDFSRSPGQSVPSQNRRVRFVNYYTASTGRPKLPKTPPTPPTPVANDDETPKSIELGMDGLRLNSVHKRSGSQTPSIVVEEHADGTVTPRPLADAIDGPPIQEQIEHLGESSGVQQDFDEPPAMQHIDSIPMDDDEELYSAAPLTYATTEVSQAPSEEVKPTNPEPPLPPIPDAPVEPEAIDLNLYTDKDSRKIAEKEHKRATKAYQQAVKDRDSAINDRKKLIEKREKKAKQDQEKQTKAAEKQRLKEEKAKEKQLSGEDKRLAEEAKRLAAEEKRMADEAKRLAGNHSDSKAKEKEQEKQASGPKSNAKGKERDRQASVTPSTEDDKPKRDKKFCMLPPKYGGEIDKCWVRIFMEGVDEVGAHCGLFFAGPHYESLVGDVGARIGKWVEDDATRRAIIAAEAH